VDRKEEEGKKNAARRKAGEDMEERIKVLIRRSILFSSSVNDYRPHSWPLLSF